MYGIQIQMLLDDLYPFFIYYVQNLWHKLDSFISAFFFSFKCLAWNYDAGQDPTIFDTPVSSKYFISN